jgi:hypothetical protein
MLVELVVPVVVTVLAPDDAVLPVPVVLEVALLTVMSTRLPQWRSGRH